jgi:hypothetical protein
MISSDLQQSIDKLYLEFDRERPTSIDACPCCISEEEVHALLSNSLRELEPCYLRNYTDCALVTVGEVDDFKYFLPRILEILAHHTEWWNWVEIGSELYSYFPSPELIFSKLRTLAIWNELFQEERQAIVYFLDAVLNELLRREENTGWEIDSCLFALSICVDDISPYLNQLLESQNWQKVKEFYSVHKRELEENRPLSIGWWDNVEEDKKQIVSQWLLSNQVAKIMHI